jgi:23S rRNA (pseudouridine1915-N3)-methyltransferase
VKITLLLVGKTTENYLNEAVSEYLKRLKRYITFELVVIPELKNTKNISCEQQKEKEGLAILSAIETSDEVILLDERGLEYSSVEFASFIEKKGLNSVKRLIFVVGGPYGFSREVYARANGQVSLSQMTFSHQMIRLFFVEQLYRAMTIIKGEPYHHV